MVAHISLENFCDLNYILKSLISWPFQSISRIISCYCANGHSAQGDWTTVMNMLIGSSSWFKRIFPLGHCCARNDGTDHTFTKYGHKWFSTETAFQLKKKRPTNFEHLAIAHSTLSLLCVWKWTHFIISSHRRTHPSHIYLHFPLVFILMNDHVNIAICIKWQYLPWERDNGFLVKKRLLHDLFTWSTEWKKNSLWFNAISVQKPIERKNVTIKNWLARNSFEQIGSN